MTVTGATAPPSSGRFSAQLLPLLRPPPDGGVAAPLRAFKRVLGQRRPAFLGLQQHDAHELLCELFDGLDQEAKATERRRAGGKGKAAAAAAAGKPPTASPVARAFGFELRTQLSCDACGHTSTPADESCSHLSLTLPPPTADERPPPPLPRAPFASPASGKHDDAFSFPADDDAPAAPAPKMPKLSKGERSSTWAFSNRRRRKGWAPPSSNLRARLDLPPLPKPLPAITAAAVAAADSLFDPPKSRRPAAPPPPPAAVGASPARRCTRRRRRSAAASRASRAKRSARRAPTRARAG